jgi:hypothetical protein
MAQSLVARDDAAIAPHVSGGAQQTRLSIYRNNFAGALTAALKLAFPVVCRITGEAFFESAARIFLEGHPPRSACLDRYGGDFPSFLACYAPAAPLAYLADVARLEWAVTCALHAEDAEVVSFDALAAVKQEEQERIVLRPHPSITLARSVYPVDAIWQAVLTRDDDALRAINLEDGPVFLLVRRGAQGVGLVRLDEIAWRFAAELFCAKSLQTAMEAVAPADPAPLLAAHLARGDFIGFTVAEGA